MAIHNCYLIGVLLCKQEALMEARMKIKIQVLPLLSTMGSIIFEFVFSDQMHNDVKNLLTASASKVLQFTGFIVV